MDREMDKDITIRTAVYSDLHSIIELCRSTDRMVSHDEVSTWMQSDPGCCFVAELAKDDACNHQVIASCCGLRFGLELGLMGLYMVHENYRRRGIGKRIWNCAMERLAGRNIGVKAYIDIFPYYEERYGFRHYYKIAYYKCFDGLKLQSEAPSTHGLSVATIFEGQLIKAQSSKCGNGGKSSLGMLGDFPTCAKIKAAIEDDAYTNADSCLLNTFSEEIGKYFTKLNNEYVASATNKSIVTPSADVSFKNHHSNLGRITNDESENVSLLKEKSALLSSARDLAVSHLCKDSLGTAECISESEKETVAPSRNDASSKCISLKNYEADLRRKSVDAAEINIKTSLSSCEDLCAAPQHDVSVKDKTIQFSFDDLLDSVVNYDQRLHNLDRSFIVRQTFSWKTCRTKIAIANDNTVVGYGCFRQCVNGRWILSPLYAESQEIAELLLWELLRDFDFAEAPVGILSFYPDMNTGCTELLRRFGFQDTEGCGFAGYTEECITLIADRVYSFHSMDV